MTINDDHDELSLDDNPGLEHDDATEAGRMMTGGGSRGRDEGDPRSKPTKGGGGPGAPGSHETSSDGE